MRALFAAVLIALAAPAAAFESVYQTINLDTDCTDVEKSDDDGGTWKCKGIKDYPVWFSEGDARQSVFFGHVGDWFKKRAWESFGPFNYYSETIEWLTDKGTPVAAITRFFIQNSDENTDETKGQVLVVSKVGQPGAGEACVVGYVDARANKEPNVLARQVAEKLVTSFKCRVDEPVYHGVRGPYAADPSRNFE
jgi:hypothetical protein